MVSWGWMIIISLAWMLLVNFTFSFLIFHGDKRKYGLGTVFFCLMTMFIPVLIFVFTNIMCWINAENETAYRVIMWILAGIFIGGPILYVVGKCIFLLVKYPPKRMAAYARKEVGSYHYYHKKKMTPRKDVPVNHEDEKTYITEQIWFTRRKLGITYRLRSRRGKKRFIRAIMEANRKEIPQITGWDYQTVLAGTCRAETAVRISFTDGKEEIVNLYWPKKSFTPDELMESDRKKLELADRFRNITMTGRMIYIFMCIERYLISLYPERDWSIAASRIWNRTKEQGKWSEGTPGDLYREIVPERIMRFYKHGYGYKELNPMVFDNQLSQEDYTLLRGLYQGISRGDPKEEINQIVGLPEKLIYMINLRDYPFDLSDQMTVESIQTAEEILKKHGIELPEHSLIERFSFDRTADVMPDKDRDIFFGFGVDADELSILLNKENAPVREKLIEAYRERNPEPEAEKNKETVSMIREIRQNEIRDVVRVIRTGFQTVADEFGFTVENAPRFTAFATTEERVKNWMIDKDRLVYGYYDDERLVGVYNLYLMNDSCELGSLSVLPEFRHKGIGKKLLDDAMIRAAVRDLGKITLAIVEENTVLRKWYEKSGFIHTETKKFDFFPFTCGYLERDLRELPMRIEKVLIARGHIVLWMEKEGEVPRFVYIPGELSTIGRFYADLYREWNWIEKPDGSKLFITDMTVLGTVTDEEKVHLIAAVNSRNKSSDENVQIVFD